jgi:drug/metabolite transporter (DMT)-like permease
MKFAGPQWWTGRLVSFLATLGTGALFGVVARRGGGRLFALAIVLYVRSTRAKDRVGTIAWWAFVVLLLALYLPGPWSPPPPSENVVAIMGIIALAIFGPWAYWIDRHREIRR